MDQDREWLWCGWMPWYDGRDGANLAPVTQERATQDMDALFDRARELPGEMRIGIARAALAVGEAHRAVPGAAKSSRGD
jgi:hypothetical protein